MGDLWVPGRAEDQATSPSAAVLGDWVLIGLLRQLLRLSSLKMQHLSIFFVKDLVGRLNHLLKLDLWVIVGSLLPIFYLCPISSN